MASQPNYDLERRLTREESDELLKSMYGFLHETYEKLGGVEAVIRHMRDEDGPELILE